MKLNTAVFHKALGAAHAGHIDHAHSEPVYSEHTGIAHDETQKGKEKEWAYPVLTSGGQVSAVHVASALHYAKTNNEHELVGPLEKIDAAIHAQGKNASIYYLSSDLESALIEADPAGLPKEILGQPVRYFWGHGLKIGQKYIHPVKKWEMNASRSFCDGLVDNFNQMAANGVKVPIVDDHVETAGNSRGYIVGVREKDGWVEPLLQVIGDDAIRTAARNEISLGIKPFTDAQGRNYGLSIVHCALTPVPVVPNQHGLRAASRGQDADAPMVFHLAAGSTPKSPMLNCSMSPEQVAHMKRFCDMADGDAADGDQLISRYVEKVKALATKHAAEGDEHKALIGKHNKLVADHQDLITRHDAAEKNLSRLAPLAPESNAEVLFERSLRVGERFDRLLSLGYSPAQIDKLKTTFVGTAEAPNGFMLSRGADRKTDCMAAVIADILAETKPMPKQGETTTYQMSRPQDAGQQQQEAKKNVLLEEAESMQAKKKKK